MVSYNIKSKGSVMRTTLYVTAQLSLNVVAVWVPGMMICDLRLKSHCQGLPHSHDRSC